MIKPKYYRPVLFVCFVVACTTSQQSRAADPAVDEPVIVRQGRKYGLIDRASGRVLAEPTSDFIGDYSEGVFVAAANDKCGFMGPDGKYVIPPQYARARGFHDGLAAVNLKGKNEAGYIDRTGTLVIPDRFNTPGDFSEGRASFYSPGKGYGSIDRAGNVVVEPRWKGAHRFSNGRAAVEDENGLFGYVDVDGRLVVTPVWPYADSFGPDGLAVVRGRDLRPQRIDKAGQIRPEFDGAGAFSEDLVAVNRNGKWGYVDRAGRVVIPFQFEGAGPFHEGLAGVRTAEGAGYIDRTGAFAIPPRFGAAGPFEDGRAVVSEPKSSAQGVVDRSGAWIVRPKAWEIVGFREGYASFRDENGRAGMIDAAGRIALEPKYDRVNLFDRGVVYVSLDGKPGYMNKQFQFIWQAK
jgi:hypothetical protein